MLRLEDVKLTAMQWVGAEGVQREGGGRHNGWLCLSVVRAARCKVFEDIEYRTRIILNTKSIFRGKYSQKHVHQYNFENTGYMLIINHVIEYSRVR